MVSDEFEEEAEVNYFIIICNFGRKYFAIVDLKNNCKDLLVTASRSVCLTTSLDFFSKVCQKLFGKEFNAGSKDSKFSLENGNVVLTYGAQIGADEKTRYFAFFECFCKNKIRPFLFL